MDRPLALDVQGLEKTYGDLRAVNGVSLSLAPGEILGLVNNGAGKTDVLRCLGWHPAPHRGDYPHRRKGPSRDPVGAKRALAFLPDEPRLFEYLTVREHLNLVARLYGVASWEAKAEALLGELELWEKRDAVPSELSRGMKQKLTIACGFLHDPRVVLLDEPLTGLDPIAIRKMRRSITVRAARGAAILLSSHLLPLVEEVCTRVCVIARGKVRAIGTLDEIRAQLRDPSGAGGRVGGGRGGSRSRSSSCESPTRRRSRRGHFVSFASAAALLVGASVRRIDIRRLVQAAAQPRLLARGRRILPR